MLVKRNSGRSENQSTIRSGGEDSEALAAGVLRTSRAWAKAMTGVARRASAVAAAIKAWREDDCTAKSWAVAAPGANVRRWETAR